jgi:hypothetical protein
MATPEPTFGFERDNRKLEMTPPAEKTLADVVAKYKSLVGNIFGTPVALEAFGFSPEETERTFALFDEDYNISRYFHFTEAPHFAAGRARSYKINGFPQTHVSLDAEIADIL